MSILELITGSMSCGKTEEMLRRIHNEQKARKKVRIFKPVIDGCYSVSTASSHNRSEFSAISVVETRDIYKHLVPSVEVVGIAEVQFLDDKIIDFCLEQIAQGRKVIASGINLDFRGEPFHFRNSQRHIGDLMVYAVTQTLRARCVYQVKKYRSRKTINCDAEADYTQRLIDGKLAPYDSPTILVGSKKSDSSKVEYEARCARHFERPKPPKK
ncbi:thymidine kinase [Candidatus Woesearchaeota archaeon]|nr:thymidine kinase [Candidatus Woesearchaeota archaeon]